MKAQKSKRLQVTGKLVVFVSVMVMLIISAVTTIFYISLDRVYQNWIDSSYESYDLNIKTATESLVSVLQVNYDRYKSGEITEKEALDNAKAIVRDTRYDNGNGYFWADTSTGLCAVHMNPEYEGKRALR